jgi:hypothetical protein
MTAILFTMCICATVTVSMLAAAFVQVSEADAARATREAESY